MFCGLRFKCCFLSDFVTFLMPSGLHSAPFFRKKPFRKLLQKQKPPLLENEELSPCPRAPRDAASRAHNSNNCSSSNYCSNSNQYLFELIAIATVSKKIEKMEMVDVKTQFLVISTRIGQRPGDVHWPSFNGP